MIEIYPRLLTGPVVKSSAEDRLAYLEAAFPEIEPSMMEGAASSEDAFDAAVSALVLGRHSDQLGGMEQATDPMTLLEGAIWSPAGGVEPVALAATAPERPASSSRSPARPSWCTSRSGCPSSWATRVLGSRTRGRCNG